jgi:hypothetical protein
VERLRPAYRAMLAEQGFAVIYYAWPFEPET